MLNFAFGGMSSHPSTEATLAPSLNGLPGPGGVDHGPQVLPVYPSHALGWPLHGAQRDGSQSWLSGCPLQPAGPARGPDSPEVECTGRWASGPLLGASGFQPLLLCPFGSERLPLTTGPA